MAIGYHITLKLENADALKLSIIGFSSRLIMIIVQFKKGSSLCLRVINLSPSHSFLLSYVGPSIDGAVSGLTLPLLKVGPP